MEASSYRHPGVGAFYEDNGACTFTVWAPEKKTVELIHDQKPHHMTPDAMGYWTVRLEGVKPADPYEFLLDNKKQLPDPASRWQPQGVHKASAVTNRSFSWTDSIWQGLPLQELVIYELHVGTFTAKGDFDGVASKLDYLKDLGVNAIELMPVAQFPGSRNWGYDGVYPFAVQESYGGIAGLKNLVNEAHARDIAVILDVVYNHQGPEGNYLNEYGPYFTDKYRSVWGASINFDDASCDPVRNFYWQNALMWLDEFHIDGLRLDAVHAIWDFSSRHFLEELTAKVDILENQTGKSKILIAEIDLNNPRYINSPLKGGYGLDGQWSDEYHHALHALITGEKSGYYEDFGELEHLERAMNDSYVYIGQYSIHRKKQFGTLPETNAYSQFVVFAQNHDQIGNRLLGDRLSTQLGFEALKLTAATILLSPHVPMLFMGEEYGAKNPFQYFISHTDQKLVSLVQEGRKKEFAYFNWEGEIPDPAAEETFGQCILTWDAHDINSKMLLEYHRFLIRFRRERKAMQGQERNALNVLGTYGKLIALERMHEGDYLLILINFDTSPAEFTVKLPYALRKIDDSSSPKWNGPGETDSTRDSLTINPNAAVIYEKI